MAELFRIETDRVLLTWSAAARGGTRTLPSDLPGLGRLAISARRRHADAELRCWRADVPSGVAELVSETAGPRLFEETTYSVFAHSSTRHTIAVRHRDPALGRNLISINDGQTVQGTVNFRSQVGRSRFTVAVDGEPEFEFEVEVFPTKLDYAADYERLMAEVQEILTGLVVEYLRSTFQLGLEAETPQPTHVEWLILLRHILSDLEKALNHVAQRPVWGLTREPEVVRVERLKRTDSLVRRAVLKGRGSGPMAKLAIGLPVRQKLHERRARPTLDTPEHRWLASQLSRIRRHLADILESERLSARQAEKRGHRTASERSAQVISELEAFERRIVRLSRLQPLTAAAGAPPPGFVSLQLLSTPGYREAYRNCLILALGLRLTGGPVTLSVKELHLLYEYWCYLAVLRLLADATGKDVPPSKLLIPEEQGLRVLLKKGQPTEVTLAGEGQRSLSITYNPLFRGPNYLAAQQPDLLVKIDDQHWPPVRLVLDAKYRLDSSQSYVEQYGAPGPPDDTINVLHRYRDAILEADGEPPTAGLKRSVIQGVVLYPSRFDPPDEFKGSRLWQSLERIGIGALPFLPGETSHVAEWLENVLQQGGWTLADRALSHRSSDASRGWQQAASEIVRIGVLRAGAEADHIRWIVENRLYSSQVLEEQPGQYTASWLAIYTPPPFREPGAVTHVAKVRDSSVLKGHEIGSPWSVQDPDQLQVVYYLDELVELPRPLEHLEAEELSVFLATRPFTNSLALKRAHEFKELLLRTEPEWRLYEDLRAAAIYFAIHADDPTDKAWFATDVARIQYRAAAGHYFLGIGGRDEYIARSIDVVGRLQQLRR